ncbi:unnamed protein product [Cuscuta campestris]|uniref:Uncharacterized protein n=1 Tax=Cuscuta campestris TaxID=132261 RepID=A0A484M4I8_9ASTE|nr:unnamed protein product [Cuscuta campestris]
MQFKNMQRVGKTMTPPIRHGCNCTKSGFVGVLPRQETGRVTPKCRSTRSQEIKCHHRCFGAPHRHRHLRQRPE